MGDPVAMAKAMRLVMTKQAASTAKGADANDVIDMGPLIPVWTEGSYSIGDVRMYAGYPYKCCQAHNSTGNSGWYPAAVPALWAPYHAADAAHALPWVKPTGAQDAYQTGEYMVWTDGKTYRCKMAACVYSPTEYAAGWGVVA